MRDPLIILAPPRSFTSIVCSMLGQHPEMYGLPEVHLLVAETMQERARWVARPSWRPGVPRGWREHGLLRVVAQLFAGEQTRQSIAGAKRWVNIRVNRTCVSVFRELAEKVSPRMLVEKSPSTPSRCEHLQRARRAFPSAKFIHLLRHPRSYGQSLWYTEHMNILTFLDGLPEAQQMRLRGEDLLREPGSYLRQVAEWLGLRADAEAIDAMKHPERSPYACFGPVNAPFGNNRSFLQAPVLRNSPAKPLKRHGALSRPDGPEELSPEVRELAREFGYTWGGNTDGNNMDECRLATAAPGGALRQKRLS